jgi:hypothetical protein
MGVRRSSWRVHTRMNIRQETVKKTLMLRSSKTVMIQKTFINTVRLKENCRLEIVCRTLDNLKIKLRKPYLRHMV